MELNNHEAAFAFSELLKSVCIFIPAITSYNNALSSLAESYGYLLGDISFLIEGEATHEKIVRCSLLNAIWNTV